jgi:hypothetical protein
MAFALSVTCSLLRIELMLLLIVFRLRKSRRAISGLLAPAATRSRISRYERLALFDSKKRRKVGRRWAQVHTVPWFHGLGVHLLTGTVRYTSSATAST